MIESPCRAKAGWQIDRTQPIYTQKGYSLIVSRRKLTSDTRFSRALRTLKCLFRFSDVSRAVFEAGEFFEEGELNFADGAVALFGDD
jgi:hypothetical protein